MPPPTTDPAQPPAAQPRTTSAATPTSAAPGTPDLPDGALDLLPRAFYLRDVTDVARDLLGRLLIHHTPEGPAAIRIVETEAYDGAGADPASHAHRGPTRRNASMFGPPGHLYAYFTYGTHWCVNVVCAPEGTAAAVLVRAGEPVIGTELMRRRRGDRPDRDLTRGPARLAQALALDGSADGASLSAGPVRLTAGWPLPDSEVAWTPRIGIRHAADRPWRAASTISPYVSAAPAARPKAARAP
jgi:DNA-3-methyladenine glycosylase